jgi:hypothetical protein
MVCFLIATTFELRRHSRRARSHKKEGEGGAKPLLYDGNDDDEEEAAGHADGASEPASLPLPPRLTAPEPAGSAEGSMRLHSRSKCPQI